MHTNPVRRRLLAGAAALLSAGALTACGSVNTTATPNQAASTSTLKTLQAASTITIHKSTISFGDKWSVSVGGRTLATVHGKAASYLDTYSMDNSSGDLLGFEKENLHFFLHRATTYSDNAQSNGQIDEQFHFVTYSETIKNSTGATIGSMHEHIGLTKRGDILDPSGRVAYSFSKKFLSLGDTYTITRHAGDIPVIDALWSVMIFNEADGK
jgi:uncharacterized protein YxjI